MDDNGLFSFFPITSAARDLLAVPSWLSLEQNRDPFAAVLHFQFWVIINAENYRAVGSRGCWYACSCCCTGCSVRIVCRTSSSFSEGCSGFVYTPWAAKMLETSTRVCRFWKLPAWWDGGRVSSMTDGQCHILLLLQLFSHKTQVLKVLHSHYWIRHNVSLSW